MLFTKELVIKDCQHEHHRGHIEVRASTIFLLYLKISFFPKLPIKNFPIINENSSYEIPVENINGNILCIASSKDEVWNALQASKRIQKRLAQYNFQYRFNSTYVENAGHMLTIPGQPNNRYKTTDKKLIMDDTYETWNRTVSYFKDNLKQNYTKSS